MDIDIYYDTLEEWALDISISKLDIDKFIESKIEIKDKSALELIDFRRGIIDNSDIERVRSLLISGLFSGFPLDLRITFLVITFDVEIFVSKVGWKRRCELYQPQQKLFIKEPKLFNSIRTKQNGLMDYELIKDEAIDQLGDSEIVRLQNSYAYIDCGIGPLYKWAKSNFTKSPFYIRLNPHEVFESLPNQMIFESIIMPANPNWWKNLSIHNRQKEGCSYQLDDCLPEVDIKQFWDYNIKKIIRLEVIAKRNNSGNLSMMIEELTAIKNDKLRFGRIIHLDTDSPYGSNFENAKLNHLDLAINVYEGASAVIRGEENLAAGNKTVDATFRTHLLRVENLEFKALFGFATCFFKSEILVSQWFKDQFQMQALQ